jgi:hypothetical protein
MMAGAYSVKIQNRRPDLLLRAASLFTPIEMR